MIIKPLNSLISEFNEIRRICKEESQPVYLTQDGRLDLVILSIEAFEQREKILDLRMKLLEAEQLRLSGAKTYTIDEVRESLLSLIDVIDLH